MSDYSSLKMKAKTCNSMVIGCATLLDIFDEIDRLRHGLRRAAASCQDAVCKRDLNELLKGEA